MIESTWHCDFKGCEETGQSSDIEQPGFPLPDGWSNIFRKQWCAIHTQQVRDLLGVPKPKGTFPYGA